MVDWSEQITYIPAADADAVEVARVRQLLSQGGRRDLAALCDDRLLEWVLAPGVRLNPRIQAGAPCVDGTRIPTATVIGLLDDSDPKDAAIDFDLPVEAVLAVADFERQLHTRVGLASVRSSQAGR